MTGAFPGPAGWRRLSGAAIGALAIGMVGCESGGSDAPGDVALSENGQALRHVPTFEPADCRFAIAADLDIRCGLVSVPARRDVADPAFIDLAVTIFPAVDGTGARPPVIFLDGGPGEIAFFEAVDGYDPLDDWLHIADAVGTDRDFVLLEQRGVGFSGPDLDCPELEAVAEGGVIDTGAIIEAEVAAVAECRVRLAETLDEVAITTQESAADVLAVADALDAGRFALMGVSYGSRLALEVMRQAPDRVEAAVLDSVYPPSVNWFEQGADLYRAAFDAVFDACAADRTCDDVFPDIADRFHAMLEAVRRDPVSVTIVDEEGGEERAAVLLDDVGTVEGLFLLLYDSDVIAGLPSLLDGVAPADANAVDENAGEPAILAEYIDYPHLGSRSSAEGQYLAIECAESVLAADEERVNAALAGDGPYERAARAHWEQMRAVCGAWNAAPAPRPAPVSVDVPTLLLTGRFDPVTPVRWARDLARGLPQSMLLEFPDASHSVMTSNPCALRTAAAFLERGTTDEACLAERRPVTFVTDRQFRP